MFTEKLPAWREKQRAKMALFQGKIQVEKSGGNLAHIRCVTPTTTPPTAQHNISHKQAISLQLQCFHEAWARFEKKVPTLGGGQWGARWGTPGSKVGSRVGNPGEQGGEQGGGTPSDSHNTTEQGISGGSDGTSQPVFATITCDISKWGAPVSRRAPLRQLCAYDVSRCPCDYPSVVPDPG